SFDNGTYHLPVRSIVSSEFNTVPQIPPHKNKKSLIHHTAITFITCRHHNHHHLIFFHHPRARSRSLTFTHSHGTGAGDSIFKTHKHRIAGSIKRIPQLSHTNQFDIQKSLDNSV